MNSKKKMKKKKRKKNCNEIESIYRSHIWARLLLFDLFLIDGDNVYSFIVLSHEYSLVRFIMADLFNVLIFSSLSLDDNGDVVVDCSGNHYLFIHLFIYSQLFSNKNRIN